ncbi:hypothetical protein BC941DRAFT_413863 [Chlamydoabsidia padenii]|nr:hypothetical protein BC941DRAFT_413863 [Chlamydoabsidia padenii]
MASSHQLIKFENQVAGHDNLLQLSTNDLMVLKPSIQQEREFYEGSLQYEDFMEWIPECYGTLRASTDKEMQLLNNGQDIATLQTDALTSGSPIVDSADGDEHLCLENILSGFTRPCIMDIKLGYKIYEDTADEAKRIKMIKNAKGTTIESLGLRISGMKTFDSVQRHYTSYPKQYGRERTKDNFLNGLLSFFYPTFQLDDNMGPDNIPQYCTRSKDKQDGNIIKKPVTKKKMEWILEHYMDTINDMRTFIEHHSELQLVGCSLLLVYEGDAAAAQQVWKRMLEEDRQQDMTINHGNDDDDADLVEPKLCDIRLIDFGRSRWVPERTEQDTSFIKALDNLLVMLNQVLELSPC